MALQPTATKIWSFITRNYHIITKTAYSIITTSIPIQSQTDWVTLSYSCCFDAPISLWGQQLTVTGHRPGPCLQSNHVKGNKTASSLPQCCSCHYYRVRLGLLNNLPADTHHMVMVVHQNGGHNFPTHFTKFPPVLTPFVLMNIVFLLACVFMCVFFFLFYLKLLVCISEAWEVPCHFWPGSTPCKNVKAWKCR